jgi:hypothetical protein
LLDVSDEKRNQLCTAVPHPELKQDLPGCLLTTVQNMINCNLRLPLWLRRTRLNIAHYEAPHRYLLGGAKVALLHRRAVSSMDRMLPAGERTPH